MPAPIRLAAVVLVLFAAAAPQLGCSGKYDSPEACFKTLQIAGHNKDMPGMCDCLTDESQETLAGMLVVSSGLMKMQKGGEAVAVVLEKHGVTAEAVQAQAANVTPTSGADGLRNFAKLVKNKTAFIADMFAAMQQLGAAANFSEQFETQIAGELKDVKIDGDQATAVVVTATGSDQLEFRKTPGGWKLQIQMGGTGPASPPA